MRKTDAEIREVARVVKLVGDLPNVVYLLAYDRARVERALGGPGDRAEGRAYLEKIVQVTHDLPEAPVSALRALLEEGVAEVLGASIGDAAKRLRRGWPYIGRRMRTVRDVRRLLNVLPITLALLGGEVAIEDVVCLEVMRLLDLEGWEQLPAMARLLTSAPILASLEDQPSRQKRLTAWVQEPAEAGGGSEPSHARHSLLDCLFPVGVAGLKGLTDATVAAAYEQSPRWRAEGRVATGRFLALYLSGTRSDGGLARSTVVEVVRRLSANDPLAELGEDMSERQVGELLVELNYRLNELDEGSLELTARELSLLVDRRASRAGSRSVPLGDGFDLARVVAAWR